MFNAHLPHFNELESFLSSNRLSQRIEVIHTMVHNGDENLKFGKHWG
jgi:hypothetical protein